MLSLIIEGGTIVDGSGRPRFSTDLALAQGRIARIGDCSEYDAVRRIDARGAIVAPGFIDTASQAPPDDEAPPCLLSKRSQGIVSEIGFAGLEPAGALGASIDLRATPVERAIQIALAARADGKPRIHVRLRDHARELTESVAEALAIAATSDVELHIADLHVEGRANWGGTERALEQIDRARTRGASVTCDLYPYVATWIELASLLPASITADALDDERIAAASALEMEGRLGDIWHDIMLAEVAREERYAWCGMRFDEIARQMRLRPARAIIEFIRNDRARARAFHFCMHEDDIANVLSAGFCTIGTSAPALGERDARFGLVHPRAFGTFPRVIGRFVRQRRTLTLEEAIHRMTGLPARTFGLDKTGELRAEMRADLIVFDEREFIDTATYEQPVSVALGLKHLFIAGEAKGG
jgi:N-acyl-D-amino-acid deacylase